jgi:phage-related protein
MPTVVPAPILEVTPRWGYRREVALSAKSIRLGDGYTLLSTVGNRRYTERATVSTPATPQEEFIPIVDLLRSLAGARPFQWSATGANRKEYTAEQWQIVNAGPGLARFSSTFERFNGMAPLVARSVIPPEIPITLTWDTPFNDAAIVNERRVDEGVDRRSPLHLNPVQRSFPVRVVTDDEAGLEQLLLGLYGAPFRLGQVNRRLDEPDWWFNCMAWTFEGLGNGLSRFDAEFNQVRPRK